MALGKAFIEVHADTTPFARELGRDLLRILNSVENREIRTAARSLGQTIADETGTGFQRNRANLGKSVKGAFDALGEDRGIFAKFSKGIIDSIDDGLSGLPAEVKVALGATLLAISPFLAAGITAAVSAGLGAAFAGIGVLLASQFVEVQQAWEGFASRIRDTFVGFAAPFIEPLIEAFTFLEDETGRLGGWFREAFAQAARFVEPLVMTFTGFIEGLLPGLLDGLRNIEPVIQQLSRSAGQFGQAFGIAIRLITESRYADDALRDLVGLLSVLVVTTGLLVRGLTEVYGIARDISLLITGQFAAFAAGQAADKQAEAARNAASANGLWRDGIVGTLTPLEEQAAVTNELNNILADYVRQQFSSARANIGFEQSLDDMIAELNNGSRTLEINSQAGRDNQLAILGAAEALIRQRDETIKLTGDTNTANATFETNRKRLEDAAVAAGISRDRFQELTDKILAVPGPVATGVTPGTLSNLNTAISRFQTLGALLGSVITQAARAAAAAANAGYGAQGGGGSIPAYADGGIVTKPTLGLIGEAGDEAVIPLSNPARAAALLNQSGLSAMMSPQVNVYIGNEQIDAYIRTQTANELNNTARSMSYGTRGI
jgi:hypothetical protein